MFRLRLAKAEPYAACVSLMEKYKTLARVARGRALVAANAPDMVAPRYGGTDKYDHGYVRYYRKHFSDRRFKTLTVVEIGVGGHEAEVAGRSLPFWRDYFPRSQIIGIDLYDKRINFGSRVHFEKADQNSTVDLRRIVRKYGPPDIVIDDGSHIGEHIQTSFRTLWPLMRSGGLYAVEDLASSYFPHSGGADPAPATSGLGLVASLLDSVQGLDPTFSIHPDWGSRSKPEYSDVAAVHCYPGIAFFAKSRFDLAKAPATPSSND